MAAGSYKSLRGLPTQLPRWLYGLTVMALMAGLISTGRAQAPGRPSPLDDPANVQWLAVSDPRLEVDGLPWLKENHGQLYRLPLRLKDSIDPAVWKLACSPSGGRIRFRTDTKFLGIRLRYPAPPEMLNMQSLGQTGVDLYVDGEYRATAFADHQASPEHLYERLYFDFSQNPRREREITLYLSLYSPVAVEGIGFDRQARILPARPFSLSKPVVFYGTSITQGGCASRSGMSYEAMLGRRLNIDYVNLGFSGHGTGAPAEARAVAEIDAACFVLDYGINNRTLESLKKAYAPFLQILRSAHPQTPILVITPIYESHEFWPGGDTPPGEAMREYLRSLVAERIAAGDTHLQLLEGTDLLGPADGDGLTDEYHPNDLGFRMMSERMAPYLQKTLNLPQGEQAHSGK